MIDGREADDTEAIWHHVWWALHYAGRGGPPVLALSALDIALWDLKARRANLPYLVYSAASTPACPVTPVASTSISPSRHFFRKSPARRQPLAASGEVTGRSPTTWREHQTTNLGVRSSNLFGRASDFNKLSKLRDGEKAQAFSWVHAWVHVRGSSFVVTSLKTPIPSSRQIFWRTHSASAAGRLNSNP